MVDAAPRMDRVSWLTPLGNKYLPFPIAAGTAKDGLILCSHWEPGGEVWLEVVHAEPTARFAGVLLRRTATGEARPFTETDRVEIGGIIRIWARDRNLVYRITGHDAVTDIYTGEWPD